MSDKRLLIVYPYAFGTGWVGATPRILHVARGLSELGWKVELLRCKQPNEAQLKPVVDAFPGRVVTAAFNGLYPALFNRKGLRLLFRLWLRRFRGSEDREFMDVEVERIIRFVREGLYGFKAGCHLGGHGWLSSSTDCRAKIERTSYLSLRGGDSRPCAAPGQATIDERTARLMGIVP